jgi:hypothetical protein
MPAGNNHCQFVHSRVNCRKAILGKRSSFGKSKSYEPLEDSGICRSGAAAFLRRLKSANLAKAEKASVGKPMASNGRVDNHKRLRPE